MLKKISVLLLSGVMLLGCVPAYAKTSDEIRKEITETEEKLDFTQERTEAMEKAIEDTREEVADLTSEIKEIALQIEDYKTNMAMRICYFYEEDINNSFLSSLFSGEGFAYILNKLDFQQSLHEYDAEQLEEYKAYSEELKEKEATLGEAETLLDELLENQEKVESELEDTISDKNEEYEEIKAEEERIAEEERLAEEQRQQEETQTTTTTTITYTTTYGTGSAGQNSQVTYSGSTGYVAATDYSGMSNDAIRMDVATKIYSVLRAIGWNNAQIAGALGNIQVECNFDFTCIEWVSIKHPEESFGWGPYKQAAADADYLMNVINPNYMFPLVKRTGLGMIGWTDTNNGATGNTDLRNYAAKKGMNWYNLELQLMYLIDPSGGCHTAKYILNSSSYNKYSTNNYYDATYWWSNYIEGCFYDMDKRISYAGSWYNKLGSMTYDIDYATKILNAVGLSPCQ